ncbi:unnamed protein product [Sphenostylis stenocarpa]|uniref:Uncharacterized protein n=1 Tax=Sphenostylis stenocarpa TaxID=92480 RepID=A0AA86TGC3_9FABA|nr:unnamed protein product [Sphenostylis stenocarpa]
MEKLEEQNRKLSAEVDTLREQVAQLMEVIRQGQNKDGEGQAENVPPHEEEEEEYFFGGKDAKTTRILTPEVSKQQLSALEERLKAVEGHNFDVKEVADMCLVKDISLPSQIQNPGLP